MVWVDLGWAMCSACIAVGYGTDPFLGLNERTCLDSMHLGTEFCKQYLLLTAQFRSLGGTFNKIRGDSTVVCIHYCMPLF